MTQPLNNDVKFVKTKTNKGKMYYICPIERVCKKMIIILLFFFIL